MEGCDASYPKEIQTEIRELISIWKDNSTWLLLYQPVEWLGMDHAAAKSKLKDVTEMRRACRLCADQELHKFHESERRVGRLAIELEYLEKCLGSG